VGESQQDEGKRRKNFCIAKAYATQNLRKRSSGSSPQRELEGQWIQRRVGTQRKDSSEGTDLGKLVATKKRPEQARSGKRSWSRTGRKKHKGKEKNFRWIRM